MHEFVRVMYVWVFVCVRYVGVYVCMHVFVRVMYVCMYECMYVCMYVGVCMYVCTCVRTFNLKNKYAKFTHSCIKALEHSLKTLVHAHVHEYDE
jgi:hypothetical protein